MGNLIGRAMAFLESRSVSRWLLMGTLLAIAWIYWCAIDTEVAGFTHDDGVYLVTAKALAEGKGFILEHVLGQPGQVKYPILYPFILSLAWRLYSDFPQNLLFLTALTASFTIVGLYFTYRYFRLFLFSRVFSIVLVWMIATNFYFMFSATSVMSESLFFMLSMMTLWVAERFFAQGRKNFLLLVLLSVLCFHARTIGVCLIAAIGLRFLLDKQYKQAFLYGAITFLTTLLPWFLWTGFNKITPVTADNFVIAHAYSNYGSELWGYIKAGTYLKQVGDVFAELLWRLLENMFNVIPNFFKVVSGWNNTLNENPVWSVTHTVIMMLSTYVLCGYFIVLLIKAVKSYFQKFKETRSLQGVSVSFLYLTVYLCIVTLWGYPNQAGRFLLMLSPLLWVYFFQPVLRLAGNKKQVLISFFILLNLVSAPKTIASIQYVRQHHWIESGLIKYLWGEYQALFAYLNLKVPDAEPIAVAQDAAFYLYTGNPTYILTMQALSEEYTQGDKRYGETYLNALRKNNVRYLVMDPHMENREITKPHQLMAYILINEFPEAFERVYVTPKGVIDLYKIKPTNRQQ